MISLAIIFIVELTDCLNDPIVHDVIETGSPCALIGAGG